MNKASSKIKSAEVKKIYLDNTYLNCNPTWHVEDSIWKAQQIQKMLSKNNINADTICEIGCGAGEILNQLSVKNPNTKFYGFEPSPQAYELCRTKESNRIKFYNDDLLRKEIQFDVLLCIDVFEHVEDYIGFLKQLKPRATQHIFHIPLEITLSSLFSNTMINARQNVGHLHYFTPETALATLKDNGYEIVDYYYTPFFELLPRNSIRTKLKILPRKLLYSISPKLMAKLLLGLSLLVLTQ